jgi:hypothetical protein
MSTSVEIFYFCVAGFALGVLALGLYFAFASRKEVPQEDHPHLPAAH